ncbi:MAG: glycosyltransferase family 61 protein [Vicinamibacteria bacterium]|nr:glycosyltransferase family 61 protein [Vicinamibacteria bacterium]
MKRKILEVIWAVRKRLSSAARAPLARTARGEPSPRERPDWGNTILEGDAAIGYGYLDRWRRSGRDILSSGPGSASNLRLYSHNAPDTPPATHPHVIVEARDLVIDFGRIGAARELRSRPGYQRVRGGYLDYRKGALVAAATPAADLGPDLFPRDHLRDLFHSLETVSAPPPADRTIEECCLLVAREPREYENLFHAHTDWLSAFAAVRVLGLEAARKRVVMLDPHRPGSLDEVPACLFSGGEPLWRRRDFGSARVRFRHAVFVPPGYASVLWARQEAHSPGPPVGFLQDYGRFFRAAFCPRPAIATDAPLRVTLLVRRPYPGRGPVLLRRFRSDEALAAALRSVPGVTVEVVDPASMSFADQVRLAASTEILVGAHGAGLAHAFAMAEHGAILEIVAAGTSTYRLYGNLAAWTDRLHARIEAPETVGFGGSWFDPDPSQLRDEVAALAAKVRERRARA